MDTMYWHINATQGGANLHPGANCAYEHDFNSSMNHYGQHINYDLLL